MNNIDYFATFEESLEIVRALTAEGLTIIDPRVADTPVATTFATVDDTVARHLAQAPAFYLSGPFTRFPVPFSQLKSGAAAGKYAIDALTQGPLLQGLVGRINLVDGAHRLLSGHFSFQDAYRNPETNVWEQASTEVKAAFKTIVSIVNTRCPRFAYKPGVHIFLGPEARTRLESKAVDIIENQISPAECPDSVGSLPGAATCADHARREMNYENLKLRPASGSVDRVAITTWLAAKDYAFLDPLGEGTWHLSATKQEMEENRQKLIANPTALQYSTVIVFLHPDFVGVNAYRVRRAEFRALEFIRWLVSAGEWDVQIDQSPFEPIGDPARLFPEGTDGPDHTIYDLAEGVRYTWEAGGRSFIVHSSGQWRTRLRDASETWRVIEDSHGELSPTAMDEWKAAVENAGDLFEYVDGNEGAGSFELEDLDGIETAHFDLSAIPAPLKPLGSLVERWLGELARWNEASTSADLLRVRP